MEGLAVVYVFGGAVFFLTHLDNRIDELIAVTLLWPIFFPQLLIKGSISLTKRIWDL
jgi:hypothetical protein